jgi:hypothetical protein
VIATNGANPMATLDDLSIKYQAGSIAAYFLNVHGVPRTADPTRYQTNQINQK